LIRSTCKDLRASCLHLMNHIFRTKSQYITVGTVQRKKKFFSKLHLCKVLMS